MGLQMKIESWGQLGIQMGKFSQGIWKTTLQMDLESIFQKDKDIMECLKRGINKDLVNNLKIKQNL